MKYPRREQTFTTLTGETYTAIMPVSYEEAQQIRAERSGGRASIVVSVLMGMAILLAMTFPNGAAVILFGGLLLAGLFAVAITKPRTAWPICGAVVGTYLLLLLINRAGRHHR